MTPSALIRRGGPRVPNGGKLTKAGVVRLYWEALDPQVDYALHVAMIREGYQTGVMRDPIWNGYKDTPEEFIDKVNADIRRLSVDPVTGKRIPLAVMLDMEAHDSDYVFRALTKFRLTNPGRNVCWTLEWGQGGWFTQPLVELVNGYPQLRICAQLYDGPMTYTVDSQRALRDLTRHRIDETQAGFVYSLREPPLPWGWDGVLYLEDWNQLPG